MKSTSTRLPQAFLLVICAAILFSSCKKENNSNDSQQDDDLSLSIEAVQHDATATSMYDDVLIITQSASSEDAGEDIGLGTPNPFMRGGGGVDTKCFTVSVLPKIRGEWPKTVTINFGDGCLGQDGKVRKGKIVSIFTKPAFMQGSVVSTTFVGYQVDSFSVAGTHKVTNTSTNLRSSFKVEVIQGKITNTNTGFWLNHEAEHEFTQLEGWTSNINPLKNGFRVTGTTQGMNSFGQRWKTKTVSPLVRKFDCRWISKGVLNIWRNDITTPAILDFGNGTCDNKAELSFRNRTKTITLR
jgi:hypothetical protein